MSVKNYFNFFSIKYTVIKILTAICFIVCTTFFAKAQPGSLDTSFGNNGKVFLEDFKAQVNALIIQQDGKIITAGNYAGSYKQHVSRFNADGILDTTFGTKGHTIITKGDGSSSGTITSLLIQDDKKIIAAARFITGNGNSNADIGIMRFTAKGNLDSSFGENGIIIMKIGTGYDKLGEIALQRDGKILITGTKEPTYEEFSPFFLARLNTDGSYDKTFANHGISLLDFRGRVMYITSLLLLPDNKIIIAGDDLSVNYDQAIILKYNSNGSLDSSFGINGFFETSLPLYSFGVSVVYKITDVLLLSDGKFWLTGTGTAETRYTTVFLCRINANGSLDESFGNGKGFITPSFPVTTVKGYQSFFVKNNKVLVTGYYKNPDLQNDGFAAFRFNMDGSLDSSFGTDGRAVYGFDHWSEIGERGGAVQPNGRIILGGFAYPGPRLVMIGLQGDKGVTKDNYVKLKRWLNKHGLSWPGTSAARNNHYGVQRSNDGIHFTTIAYVNKAITGEANNNYVYEDPSPAKENNYYRIAYSDVTGKNLFSNIILIEESSLKIFPNPVTDILQIQNIQGGETVLKIADMAGNIQMGTATKNDNFKWNISSLKKGYYILQIQQENKEPVYKKFYKE